MWFKIFVLVWLNVLCLVDSCIFKWGIEGKFVVGVGSGVILLEFLLKVNYFVCILNVLVYFDKFLSFIFLELFLCLV